MIHKCRKLVIRQMEPGKCRGVLGSGVLGGLVWRSWKTEFVKLGICEGAEVTIIQ